MSSRKRKQKSYTLPSYSHVAAENIDSSEADPALFIQAHEADLVRGPQARIAAQSLEIQGKSGPGEGLIRWNIGSDTKTTAALDEPETVNLGSGNQEKESDDRDVIWVDRYDAHLLLDALPPVATESTTPDRFSPTGWSDLPSDAEDTFFFSPEEVEDYRREKRRRIINQSREKRLEALRADREEEIAQEEEWGESDEEPDDVQKELMRRTASHILTSPNPAQLEMRILANHGADRRFAFLRGRWSRIWRIFKQQARVDKEKEKMDKQQASRPGLGGLTGYGDSDASDNESNEAQAKEKYPRQGSAAASPRDAPSEDAIKEARRVRAKEWAEKRRAMKAADRGEAGE